VLRQEVARPDQEVEAREPGQGGGVEFWMLLRDEREQLLRPVHAADLAADLRDVSLRQRRQRPGWIEQQQAMIAAEHVASGGVAVHENAAIAAQPVELVRHAVRRMQRRGHIHLLQHELGPISLLRG
jgi:hypothetical protein